MAPSYLLLWSSPAIQFSFRLSEKLRTSVSWWWVRRFGFTPWDRKLGTTDVLSGSLTLRKVVMTLVLIILCLQLIYVLLIPWLPEMEAYAAASGQM